MKLEDFKKMTLEARLDYLFQKSQEQSIPWSQEQSIPWLHEVAEVPRKAWDDLLNTGKVEPDKSTKIIEE